MSAAPAALERHAAAVEAEMRAAFGQSDLPIYQMARYALGWEDQHGQPANAAGKGARSALVMLGADAISAEPEHQRRALAAAAAVEFVHNFSLVHDDIQDGDEERRGRPTVWRVWGVAQAINAGDALRELADQALRRGRLHGAPDDVVVDAARRLNRATLRMIEGQYLDLAFEERSDVSVNEYLAMVERKTGAMMGVSLALGAVFAGAASEQADALERAGQRLGRCFQMRDDWLGIWADPESLGKPTDADIRRRKKSFPVLHTLTHAPADARRELQRIYQQPQLSDVQVDWVHQLLSEVAADAATERAATDEYHAFQRELAHCNPRPEAVADLEALATFVLQRDR